MRANDPAKLRRDVGRRIAEARAERECTQEELAERLGVTPRYVQSVEAGDENLTIESLAKIANALSARVRDLFDPPQTRAPRRSRPRTRT
jgi:transcriptional regulator with XRE-family HTH domain